VLGALLLCALRARADDPPEAPVLLSRSEARAAVTLRSEEARTFALEVAAGEYYQLSLEPGAAATLAAVLRDASGRPIGSPVEGIAAPEVFCGVAAEAGRLRLDVRRTDPGPAAEEVTLVLEDARPARSTDSAFCSGYRSFWRGVAVFNRKEYDPALAAFEAARASYQAAGDEIGQVEALFRIGWTLKDRQGPGDLDRAIATYRQALPLVEKLLPQAAGDAGDKNIARVCGNLWNNLGEALRAAGNAPAAREVLQKAVDLARRWPNLPLGRFSKNLAFAISEAGNPEAARALYEGMIASDRSTDKDRANAEIGLGRIELGVGRLDQALEHFRRAGELATGDPEIAWGIRYERCNVFSRRGAFDEALDECKAALKLTNHSQENWAATNNTLGSVYADLGSYAEALDYFRSARSQYEALGRKVRANEALRNQGVAELALERYEDAAASFESVREFARQAGSPLLEATALQWLGRVELHRKRTGNPKTARELLERALELVRQFGDRQGQADVQLELASACARLGDARSALASFEGPAGTLALADDLGDPFRRASALSLRAEILLDQGELESALAAVDEAVELNDRLRGEVSSSDLRASFFARRRRTYELQIEILLDLASRNPDRGYPARAFESSERARARSLLDLLAERRFAENEGGGARIAESERQDLALVEALNRFEARRRLEKDPAALAALDRRIAETEAAAREIERDLRRSNPRFAEIRYSRALGAAAIQGGLEDDQILLEYIVGERAAFLFAVTREEIRAFRLGSPEEIRSRLALFLSELRKPTASDARLRLLSEALSASLLAPAGDLLAAKRRLIVAPDGDLYFLPFEVLSPPEIAGAQPPASPYLIASKTISYAPSASVLSDLSAQPVAEGGPAFLGFAVGDPGDGSPRLAEADREVRSLAALYPGQSRIFTGAEATEPLIAAERGLLACARRIHFATHGYFSSDPQRMGLRLAPDPGGGGDGLLQVFEVLRLDLAADLVVLSACETAQGQEVAGEGVIGLPRAFFYAGAKSVAVSLWKVDDVAARDLMIAFYGHLSEGLDKAEALRQAKLDLIAQGTRARPWFWAAFVLVGSVR